MTGLDWGNVPAWIGSVLTSGSVLIAALAYRRSVLDRERGQASQIGAWLALTGEEGEARPVAKASNSSNAPVYEVIISFPGLPDLSVPELISGSIVTLELPDSAQKFIRSEKRSGSVGLKLFFYEIESSRTEEKLVLGEESPKIQFRDAVGRWWRRDSTGRLSRIKGPPSIIINTHTSTSTRFRFGSQKWEHHEENTDQSST
jgi:hypothetical protein